MKEFITIVDKHKTVYCRATVGGYKVGSFSSMDRKTSFGTETSATSFTTVSFFSTSSIWVRAEIPWHHT